MATSPLDLTPPNDTGSDTLQRYRYQAQLVVPYCLDCVTNRQVRSVLVEHFEDILVEYESRWDFIQVKTRNPNLGTWKLADAMDGLQSLSRTHAAIQNINGINARYALFLEGAIAKDDLLNKLAPSDIPRNSPADVPPDLLAKVQKALGMGEWDCKVFLSRTIVQANQPTRQDVSARNMRMLGQMATGTTSPEIETTYRKLVDRILEAMAAERLENELLTYVGNPDSPSLNSYKVEKKRFTRAGIQSILGSLTYGPSLLLQRIIGPSLSSPTNLEVKLLAAGAEEDVLDSVKLLRANASAREVELLAANFDDAQLENVQNRLTVIARSIIPKHTMKRKPFASAYHELLTELMKIAAHCDPDRLFKQDPFFLMGEICMLTDECKIEWGTSHA